MAPKEPHQLFTVKFHSEIGQKIFTRAKKTQPVGFITLLYLKTQIQSIQVEQISIPIVEFDVASCPFCNNLSRPIEPESQL